MCFATLLIERMSSKRGWSYNLLNPGLALFSLTELDDSVRVVYDIPLLTTHTARTLCADQSGVI